jgi:alpha-L-arabinofuranosidase
MGHGWFQDYQHIEGFIQEALDAIEYANGDVNTYWGAKRAAAGHPEPFNLKFLAIGNEQWGKFYFDRLKIVAGAVRKAHPEIKLIGTSGPDSEGENFDLGWEAMRKQKVDMVDEHFYRPIDWFLNNMNRYDNYDRKGPKVFAGEYACHGKGKKYNHYETSLYEAAFMTDFERNADIVHITAYAPLFAHIDGWQWRPDLIWFDNTRMFKSVSYYVQQMYATNKGTNSISLTMDKKPVAGLAGQDGLFASAVVDTKENVVIVKVINTSKQAQAIKLNLNGLKGNHDVSTITLTCNDLDAENTLDNPTRIIPQNGTTKASGDKVSVIEDKLDAMTFRIYKIKK